MRRCFLQTPGEGIIVAGGGEGTGGPLPGGVALRDNFITGTNFRGLVLLGGLDRVQVAGNLVSACTASGLQTEDLSSATRRILIANNTVLDNGFGFRNFSSFEPPISVPRGQVELSGNLLLESSVADLGCVLGVGGEQNLCPRLRRPWLAAGASGATGATYRGVELQFQLPMHKEDRRLETVSFVSRKPDSSDYLRPPSDSPLAQRGRAASTRRCPPTSAPSLPRA